MPCFYYCSVAFPHGAVGWSAVCECYYDVASGSEMTPCNKIGLQIFKKGYDVHIIVAYIM